MRPIRYVSARRYGKTLPDAQGETHSETGPVETNDSEENIFTGEEDTAVDIELRDTEVQQWTQGIKQCVLFHYTATTRSLELYRDLERVCQDIDTKDTAFALEQVKQSVRRTVEQFYAQCRQYSHFLRDVAVLYRDTVPAPATTVYTPVSLYALCQVLHDRCTASTNDAIFSTESYVDESNCLEILSDITVVGPEYAQKVTKAISIVEELFASFADQEDFVEENDTTDPSAEEIEEAIEAVVGRLVFLEEKTLMYKYLFLLRRQAAYWSTYETK